MVLVEQRCVGRKPPGVVDECLPDALGTLVAFAPGRTDDWSVPEVLTRAGVRAAWADPRTAPYGAAARVALAAWGLDDLEGAVGESVGHVLQYARTGAVDVAFVSRAQVLDAPAAEVRTVSPQVVAALPQEALLLEAGRARPEARRFLDFLRSEGARSVIEAGGYTVPVPDARDSRGPIHESLPALDVGESGVGGARSG